MSFLHNILWLVEEQRFRFYLKVSSYFCYTGEYSATLENQTAPQPEPNLHIINLLVLPELTNYTVSIDLINLHVYYSIELTNTPPFLFPCSCIKRYTLFIAMAIYERQLILQFVHSYYHTRLTELTRTELECQ